MAKRRLKKKVKQRLITLLLDIVMVIALITAGYSGYKIYVSMQEDKESKESYDEIRTAVHEDTAADSMTKVSVDWNYLRSVNEDIAGWIRLDDSVVDYPFVYSPNNKYYLRRLMNGKYNRNGTIFVDYRNQRNFADRVTVLYGHHMHSGAMFADIEKYKEAGFYETHKVIQIFTPDGKYEMLPAAGYVTTGTSSYIRLTFSDDEDYMGYINKFYEKSLFQSEVTIGPQDRIILISTCSYEVDDGRFALIGKLVPVND